MATKTELHQLFENRIREQSTKTTKEITNSIKQFEKDATSIDNLCGPQEKCKTIGEFVQMFWSNQQKDT